MYKNDLDRLCAGGLVATLMLLITACGGGGDTSNPPPNHAPVANAGSAQTVFKASAVTLDGSASSDADGDQLTYSWAQTGGPSVTLSSLATAKPTFTAPTTTGTLVFSLVVSDGKANSTASTVSITVQNRAPTAMAGSNTSVLPMVIFTLDGTGSSDPDGDPLQYTWTQTQGVPVTLVASTAGKMTFTSPSQVGALQFSLVVNDGEVDSQPSAITITVTAAPLPQALAGMDQTVGKRAIVDLVGSGIDALNRLLTFQWQQVSGTPVTILGGTSAHMAFTSPATEGDLKFSLTVNDGLNNSLPSYVTVHVVNGAPVVATVTLSPTNPRRGDAITASVNAFDPDGDPITLSYEWKRNGNIVAGASGTAYPLGNQAKGDTISVAVTAADGSLTGTLGASTIIADTPATIAGNPPTTAVYGAPLGFQVTASDVDGDPTGTFELWYGPAGMSVSGSGQVTWTPSGPLFDRSVDMSWGVRLHDVPSVTLTGTIAVTDSTRKSPLFRSDMGMATGGNSLEVQDFNGDGHSEILVGSSRSVYIVQKSGTDYVQTWSYPFETAINTGISAVASGDVDGDGHREIFFSSGPVVVELDGVTRREIARYGSTVPVSGNFPGPYCRNLKVADVDNDGALELVCLGADSQYGFPTTGRIYVLDARSLQLKWKSDDLVLGDTLAVGNVDADATLEIVTSGGYVFNGVTGANKWAYAPGFGSLVDIGDVNGDGVGKIVATTASGLTVFDAVNKTTLWSIAAGSGVGTFNAMRVVNLDATSPSELIVADDMNVSVYQYDSGTHAPVRLTNTNILGYQVIAVGAGDVDGDGKQEIVWAPTFGLANNSPTLAIASWTPSATLLWSGPLPISLDGPFVCARLAQISPTQRTLIYATPRTRNAYSGMRVIGLDPVTGLLSASQEVDTNWSGDRPCDVGDVTGSGIDSVLLGTASLYTPYFTAYDFLSSSKQWSSPQLTGDPIAVTHLDVNADGVADLIGLTTDGHLYAWDARNQTLIWSTSGLGYGVDVAIGDLNADGKKEIIVLTSTGLNVFTFSGSNVTQTASYSIEGGSDLLVADTDGDGKADIYVLQSIFSNSITTLQRFNGALALLGSFPVGPLPPFNTNRLYLEESGFGRKNLLIALSAAGYGTAVNSQIEAVDPLSGATIWKSPPLRGDVQLDSLNFHDLYGDGKREIVFGTGYGMYITQ